MPKPSLVRVTGDGEPQDLKPGRSYAKCAETIEALAPDLIECFDAEGHLLRAMRATDAQRSDAAAMPAGLEQDPQALMLTHMANLIHRAYEHSSEVAFVKLVELVERMGDRSDAIEARLERQESANRRLLQQQLDEAFERAEDAAEKAAEQGSSGDLLEQMAGAFMGGKGRAAANGATKGKA